MIEVLCDLLLRSNVLVPEIIPLKTLPSSITTPINVVYTPIDSDKVPDDRLAPNAVDRCAFSKFTGASTKSVNRLIGENEK